MRLNRATMIKRMQTKDKHQLAETLTQPTKPTTTTENWDENNERIKFYFFLCCSILSLDSFYILSFIRTRVEHFTQSN